MTTEREKKPFWAKCTGCNHCWPVAYAPMELATFAKIALNSSKNCPMCGATKIVVAKQDNGKLLEDAA